MSQAALNTMSPERQAGRYALWFLVGSEMILFSGALVSFLLLRWNHPEWAQELKHLSAWAGGFNTVVLLTSSFSVALAHAAASRRDWDKATERLFFTLVLAASFLLVKAVEYAAKFSHGIYPSSGPFWSYYFLLTGLHALHVVAGIIALGLLWLRGLKGSLAEVGHRVTLCGLYWHLVDLVWIFLFPLFYLS